MNIRWTSRLSLSQELPRLTGLRLEVYTAIKAWNPATDGPGPTREQLAEKLGRKESSICARIKELLGNRYKKDESGFFPELVCIELGPIVQNPKTGKSAETFIALEYREERIETPAKPITDDGGQSLLFPDIQTAENRFPGAFN